MSTEPKTGQQRAMLDEVADVTVEVMYHGLDDQVLRDMLIHANELEPVPLVVTLNRSIQNELDRRQRAREEAETGRWE